MVKVKVIDLTLLSNKVTELKNQSSLLKVEVEKLKELSITVDTLIIEVDKIIKDMI